MWVPNFWVLEFVKKLRKKSVLLFTIFGEHNSKLENKSTKLKIINYTGIPEIPISDR